MTMRILACCGPAPIAPAQWRELCFQKGRVRVHQRSSLPYARQAQMHFLWMFVVDIRAVLLTDPESPNLRWRSHREYYSPRSIRGIDYQAPGIAQPLSAGQCVTTIYLG